MKPSYTTLVLLIILLKVSGQDSIPVIRWYEKGKPTTMVDSFYYQIPNTLFISLDEGFNDSIYVTINDTLMLNEYLVTNESIGYAGGFGITFKDSSDSKLLKIKFVKANVYIQEKLNLRYKSLQVRHLNRWTLIYTNHFPMRE